MASFRKKGNGWEASICCQGIRESKTFTTKLEASHWAVQAEQEILNGKRGKIPNKTFGDLMHRYSITVSPTKRGGSWEVKRITAFRRDVIADVKLSDLNSEHFSEWRDKRLLSVSAGTVLREMNLLSHILNTAVKDWNWLKSNPLSGVRRPAEPLPRDRLITERELDRLTLSLGYDYETSPDSVSARVGACLLFAVETAMRAGEIASLLWDCVDVDRCTALLTSTKNGTRRTVPLSPEAIRIILQMPRDAETVFNLTASQIDINFRKAKARAMIDDLHFHDSRHLAITRLSKKLDVLALARMVGHKDLRELMTYYNESAEEMAKKLI